MSIMTDNAAKKPRRILIFSLSYFPRLVAGAEVAVKETTDRISPDEFRFDLITLRTEEDEVFHISNVKVYGVGPRVSRPGALTKLLFPFRAFLKAKKLHRQESYDAIWSIMASYAGFAAMLFKKMNKSVPMILTIQEGEHFELREGLLAPLFRTIFRSADSIHAISNFLKAWSRSKGASCPIAVIPNGVDVASFSREISIAESSELKRALGKNEGDVLLITTGRLVAKNAVGDILRAMPLLPSNVKFVSIGRGPLESELRVLVKALKVEERVNFIDLIPQKDLPPYLHVSDIFIRPSLSEGLGNSFLEAMAAGIPVIATPVGGIPDFLVDGETGLFCEVNNPQSIAQKVEKLLKDRESRDYITRNARRMVEEKYDWKSVSARMRELFLETIERYQM